VCVCVFVCATSFLVNKRFIYRNGNNFTGMERNGDTKTHSCTPVMCSLTSASYLLQWAWLAPNGLQIEKQNISTWSTIVWVVLAVLAGVSSSADTLVRAVEIPTSSSIATRWLSSWAFINVLVTVSSWLAHIQSTIDSTHLIRISLRQSAILWPHDVVKWGILLSECLYVRLSVCPSVTFIYID